MYSEKTYIWRTLLVALMLIFYGTISAQKKVAVRNNFVYDISGTLNMGVDVRTSQHWTIGLTGGYRPWPTDDKTTRKWKHLLIAPELRYWTDSTFHKGYWGTNLIYSHYNVGHVTFPFGLYKKARDHRFEGDLIAIGLFYGRSWRVNRWLRLEGELGMAAGWTWYKKYDCNHCGTYYGKEDKPVFIPKVTLNIVYQKMLHNAQQSGIHNHHAYRHHATAATRAGRASRARQHRPCWCSAEGQPRAGTHISISPVRSHARNA